MNANIYQLAIEKMIATVVPRQMISQLMAESINFRLYSAGDSVFLTDDSTKWHYCCTPYEIEIDDQAEPLHGNARNKIAQIFAEQVSSEHIHKLEIEYATQEKESEIQLQKEKAEMQRIFDVEIKPLFSEEFLHDIVDMGSRFNTLEYRLISWGPEINLRCEFINPADRYANHYHNNIEIFFDQHNLDTFKMLTNEKIGVNEMIKGLSIDEVKSECRRVISEINEAIIHYKEFHISAKIDDIRQTRIFTLAYNILHQKKTTIFRKNNTFVAVSAGNRFSVGDKKRGKFYKLDTHKLISLITEKGYDRFCTLKPGQEEKYQVFFSDDELKMLPYKTVEDAIGKIDVDN